MKQLLLVALLLGVSGCTGFCYAPADINALDWDYIGSEITVTRETTHGQTNEEE